MYNPAVFAEHRREVLYSFICEHRLGSLITAGAGGLEASHVPFALDEATGALRCHLARANPQSAELGAGAEALVIFTGPQHYVSPSWYPSKAEHGRVVPTWNYTAVHVRGRARAMSDAELMAHLREITDANEATLPEPSWSINDAPPEFVNALAGSIVGFEILIDGIEGKFKLSQNRALADREGAVRGLRSLHTYASISVAELME